MPEKDENKVRRSRRLPHKLLFFIASLVFLALFYAFSLFNRGNRLANFDFAATVRLQSHIPITFDPFFSILSISGNFEFVIVALLLALLLHRKLRSVAIIALFALAHIVEVFGKNILNHPGPPRMFLRFQFSEFPQFYVSTRGSYPSGHSMRMLFLAVVIAALVYMSHRFSPRSRLVLWGAIALYTILMLLSRVTLGEHWTSDVIAGSLLGASFGFLSLIFL